MTLKSKSSFLISALALIILAFASLPVKSQEQPVLDKFRRVETPIPNQYIVIFNDDISDKDIDSLISTLTKLTGSGKIEATYRYSVKGFSIHDISEEMAMTMSRNPQVEFVEENCSGATTAVQSIPTPTSTNGSPWHLDRIDQTSGTLDNSFTYNPTGGSGVKAYVLDTGIRTTHQKLGGRAVFGADFIGGSTMGGGGDCYVEPSTGANDGHGTPAAGVLGANDYGVARGATIYSVRVCDCAGHCPTDKVIQGVDWVTANHVKPAVANLSLRISGISTAVEKSVRMSLAAGITYVVAAGNDSDNASNYSPGRLEEVITVGATGNSNVFPIFNPVSDQRVSYSNFGSALDIFAPGAYTSSISVHSDTDVANRTNWGGTSSATPQTAGVAALYLQADPTACPCTVSTAIKDVATNGVVMDPNSIDKLLFMPQTWSGISYKSLSFNGINSYVEVPTTSNPQGVKLNISGPVTVEAWIKLTNNTVRNSIIERYMDTMGTEGGYALRVLPNGKLKFLTLVNGFSTDSITGGTTLNTGTWYHVAGVFDGSQLRVYVNGVLDGSKSSTFAPGFGTSSVYIGRGGDGLGYFNGLIDEARVTAAAVYTTSPFNYLSLKKLTGIIESKGLWKFDKADPVTPSKIWDCGAINNGTLFNATYSTDIP
jgi:hypothetical protein